MSKLTDRMMAIAHATGQTAIIGTYPFKEEWFAAVGAGGSTVEAYGSNPEAALKALVDALLVLSESAASRAQEASERVTRLRGLLGVSTDIETTS